MLSLQLSKQIWLELKEHNQIFLNLAILLNHEIHVLVDKHFQGVCLKYDGKVVDLSWFGLRNWSPERIRIMNWSECRLPTVVGHEGDVPDLLGLLWYLGTDQEEIQYQEKLKTSVDCRYWVDKSNFATIYEKSELDKAMNKISELLNLNVAKRFGVILTHDLDIVEAPNLTFKLPVAEYKNLLHAKKYFYLLKKIVSDFMFLLKNGRWGRDFEFLNWAELEMAMGYRSVFFVFSPDRNTHFPGDADYFFETRQRGKIFKTVGTAIRDLMRRGFKVGLHLSRSSNYAATEIQREFLALTAAVGAPVKLTRNHWVWMEYKNWYDYLDKFSVEYDFNVCANGYPKLSAYPYFNSNKKTMTFPTIFLDDLTFKKKNLGLAKEDAIYRLRSQLEGIKKYGGISAISFHPSEDGPSEQIYNFECKKVDVYREVLNLIKELEIPVYLPEEAKNALVQKVTITDVSDTFTHENLNYGK